MTIAFLFFLLPAAFSQTADTHSVSLLVPKSTSSIPFFMMAEKKEVDGLDIQLELFINHAQAMLRLMRGDVDLLYTGTSTGWENRLNGGPIVLINTGVWGVSYLMGKDRSIREFSDLRGKTVAIPFPGSPLDFQTRFILSKSGLDPDRDVIITYSPFSQTIPKLLMGKLDAAPLPEPLATNVEEGKNLYRLIDYKIAWANASGGDFRSPQVSLFCTEEYGSANENILMRLVNEWETHTRYVKENPGAGERVAKKYLDFQPSVLEKAIKNTEYYIPPFAENRERVISYYHMIKKFLPGKRGEIDEGFIFFPEGGGN